MRTRENMLTIRRYVLATFALAICILLVRYNIYHIRLRCSRLVGMSLSEARNYAAPRTIDMLAGLEVQGRLRGWDAMIDGRLVFTGLEPTILLRIRDDIITDAVEVDP